MQRAQQNKEQIFAPSPVSHPHYLQSCKTSLGHVLSQDAALLPWELHTCSWDQDLATYFLSRAKKQYEFLQMHGQTQPRCNFTAGRAHVPCVGYSSQIARLLPFIRTLINKTWNKPVCSLHLSASTKGKQLVVTVVSTPTKTSVYPRKQHHPLAVRCLASGKAVALVLQPGASPQLKGMAVTPVFCSPRAKSLFSARHRAHRDPSPNRAWQSFSTIWEFGGFLSLGMEFLYRWCFTGNH